MIRFASFVAALVVASAAAVVAQDDPVKATHGDWQVRCPESGACYMSQVSNNDSGAPLLATAIQRSNAQNGDVRAMMRVQAPLGVLLPRGIEMRIDGGEPIPAPFLYCDGSGCISQIGLGDEGVATLRRGAAASVRIFSIQQPETPVETRVSLMGFTSAYDDLE